MNEAVKATAQEDTISPNACYEITLAIAEACVLRPIPRRTPLLEFTERVWSEVGEDTARRQFAKSLSADECSE